MYKAIFKWTEPLTGINVVTSPGTKYTTQKTVNEDNVVLRRTIITTKFRMQLVNSWWKNGVSTASV